MKPSVTAISTAVCMTLISLLVPCAKSQEKTMDMRGRIVKISRVGTVLTVLIEGFSLDGTENRASVTVTERTPVFKERNMERQAAALEDIREGLQVQVKLKGPLQMSYPVQAQASQVLIIEP